MNFKTAFSGSALAVITAASTLALGPAAQARRLLPPCVLPPFNTARCMANRVSDPRFFCPRGYRAVRPEHAPTREITCVRNSLLPRLNHANIYKITNVDYGNGAFKLTGRRSDNRFNIWTERRFNGARAFKEIRRNSGIIYLKDFNRNLNVKLDLRHGHVVLDDNFQRKVYQIVRAH